MGNCRDCRWWAFEEDDDPQYVDSHGRRGWEMCWLGNTTDGEADRYPDMPATKVVALPDLLKVSRAKVLGYLKTAPDFGCVQFEAKPQFAPEPA